MRPGPKNTEATPFEKLLCNVYNQNNWKTRTHIKKNKKYATTSEATQARWPRHSLPTTRARARTAAEPENRCGQHSEAKTKQERLEYTKGVEVS